MDFIGPLKGDPMKREERLYDIRTVRKNIKRGLVSRKDYEARIKGLEDEKKNCEEVEVFEEEAEVTEETTETIS